MWFRESVRRSSSESGFISFVVSGFTLSPLWPKVKQVLNYVPAAVFPAIIFPGVFFNDFGTLVAISDPKIYGAVVAVVVGFYSKSIIATILSGLLSYWFIIFLL